MFIKIMLAKSVMVYAVSLGTVPAKSAQGIGEPK